jgi:hypothetical protein
MLYFYCNNNLKFFIDHIKSIQSNYSDSVEILTDIQELIQKMSIYDIPNIFIFIQHCPIEMRPEYQIHKYYLLNTEQLSKNEWIQRLISSNIKLADYSLANIQCMRRCFPTIDISYMPYMVNHAEIANYEKILDVACIMGCYGEYRMNIINAIPNVCMVEGFGKERDHLLFRHKILVNVHFNEKFRIFEQMRCNRCVFNRMIVITEKSWDIDYELKPYIIECEYDEIVSMTKHVLENYNYYYHKLFNEFDVYAIEKMYKKTMDTTFSNMLR